MARTGKIHAARQLTPRLSRVLQHLQRMCEVGATTREIIRSADVCAVNTIVAELKTLGYQITCTREEKDRFRYRLVGREISS